ncbi:MAG TPA: hypothetical protein PKU78_05340, partial [Candidatus Dojkabacteria bacterium]|nr:hypothetical protein [Candidatus Dojkabacteria bacterium]
MLKRSDTASLENKQNSKSNLGVKLNKEIPKESRTDNNKNLEKLKKGYLANSLATNKHIYAVNSKEDSERIILRSNFLSAIK